MTNVKMPERYTAHRDMITGHEFCDLYTEFQMKQYGDDRAREALEMAAKLFEPAVTPAHGFYAKTIRALAKQTK